MARTGDRKHTPRPPQAAAPAAPPTTTPSEPSPQAAPTPSTGAPATAWGARMLLHGWVSLAVWLIFGLLLEGLLGYKTPTYLADEQRRELFRLAHTHGTFLGLVLIAAALCGQRFSVPPPRAARAALRVGTSLMPLGFLLAGLWHYESDPGLFIWLVPPAALLVAFGAITFALACRGQFKSHD